MIELHCKLILDVKLLNIIICLDDKNGMLFGGKRQSRDSVLCKRILEISKETGLLMNNYSAKLFEAEDVIADEDFLLKAQKGDYCFIENTAIPESFEKIVIYRWNRVYPSDVKFDTSLILSKQLVSSFEFEGSSHSKITEEVYE